MNKMDIPALLWVGQYSTIESEIFTYLKKILCSNHKGKPCVVCKQIENNQHPYVRWLKPSGNYNRSDLDIIFSTIIYKLPEKQKFFFVIPYAERLNKAAANSLLKSLEEPPDGYRFILLSSNVNAMLATIVSRCVVEYKESGQDSKNKLFEYLKAPCVENAKDFISYIDAQKCSEYDVLAVLDKLEAYYLSVYKEDKRDVFDFFKSMRVHCPMPGSAKIALKNIYLYLLTLSS